ncbi:hypothetical protein [Streptomyces europaeiscabiei]|uniref:hypothetical protein n=1 Tax=Streptomyces europaeiscabiei TaxID=146819 RepID=UPI0029B62195|nr:hypothetical protein [Streptomyces europaeiscabiei]MDX2766978.1 hypothetical protein [Streptomyces europaeiscabiei]
MTMHDDLNRIGYQMLSRRVHAAEAVAWQALNITPLDGETAAQVLARIRYVAERDHPELLLRFEHSRIEIYTVADDCGCDENAEAYDSDHGESDDDGRYLCSKKFHGHVCGDCENEDGDGPSWRPDRYEWPCPAVAAIDGRTAAPAV